MIGGIACNDLMKEANLKPGELIPAEGRKLTKTEYDILWHLFQKIGKIWSNVYNDGANLKSSWLEMLEAKTSSDPDYTGEYTNAAYVLQELIEMYGDDNAFNLLFFGHGIPEEAPKTRLSHAKYYVVDEFIRMQVLAGGFKHFGGDSDRIPQKNYKGYIKGSRYNRQSIVRTYSPENEAK